MKQGPCSSELVLQRHLNLPHRDRRRGDHSEPLTCGGGRRSRKRGARENVSTGRAPRRVVERVECFEPELDDVVLVIGKLEFFMQRQVDRLEMRRGHCIPSEIAEGSGWGFDEGCRVVPMRGDTIRSVAVAGAGVVRAIGSLISCAGVIHPADGQSLRDSALNRRAGAQIPAAQQRVGNRIVNIPSLPLPAGSS